jgi:aflatoxin B1 aldehyde reductase
MDIVVYNPLAGGIFSGKYQSAIVVPDDGRYSDKNTTGAIYRERYLNDAVLDALKIIQTAADANNLPLVEVAFRWLLHHSQLKLGAGGNDGLLIGVSSYSQLKSNLRVIEKGPLPEDVVQALDAAWMSVKAVAANYWHLDLVYSYDTEAALFKKDRL